jgi:hypothetical protein
MSAAQTRQVLRCDDSNDRFYGRRFYIGRGIRGGTGVPAASASVYIAADEQLEDGWYNPTPHANATIRSIRSPNPPTEMPDRLIKEDVDVALSAHD